MVFQSAEPEAEIRVLLADDHVIVRAALRALLEREAEIAVVGEASDGEEALALVRDAKPDVVLMDIRMPVLDGVEATRRIVDESGDAVRVVILTNSDEEEHIFDALTAGASGFLLKDGDPAELLRGVRVVADGEALLSPSITRRLIGELSAWRRPRQSQPEELEELTPREREVMALAASGLSNTDIADALVVSPATAKTHVSRAMLKLGAHDRAQLVVLAYQSGLVTPRPAPEPAAGIAA